MKIVKWKLTAGTKNGQEIKDNKYLLGIEYVEKLKADGEKVVSMEVTSTEIIISIEE